MAIILIGFMGSGKSTLGSRLAEAFDLPFIDLDTYIEQQRSKSIPQIFEEQGERYFRQLEFEALNHLIDTNIVIATGGGIVENPNNMTLLKRNHINIWVDTNIETMYNRIIGDFNRPNANNRSQLEINNLYQSRCSRYNEIAYIKVDTEDSISQCIETIKRKLNADD